MSSRGVNKVIILGNLGQDPEVRYSQSGTPFANMSVATSESWRDKATGEPKTITEWHKVVLSGKLAEIAGEYLRKGSQVYVEGKLRTRKWKDQSGADKYTTEIIVGVGGVMQMIGSKPESAQQGGQPGGWETPQQARPAQSSVPAAQNEPPMDFDDDIPFASIGLMHPRHTIYSM